MSEIALTTSQRATLLSLQEATTLFTSTQESLTTGKKVNSAADNAVAYYQSEALYNRANTFTAIKSNIDQNIQALNTWQTATSSVETLLQEMKAVVEGARSGSTTQRTSATQQFSDLANQLAQLVNDSTYQGLNLLTSTNAQLVTQFSDRTQSIYVVDGFNLVESTGGNPQSLFTQSNAVFNAKSVLIFSEVVGNAAGPGGSPTTDIQGFSQLDLSASVGSQYPGSLVEQIFSNTDTRLDFALSQIESISQSLGTNVGILQARSDFTAQYANDQTGGGDALTLADLNTEAANSQALTLRQQLGIQSLGVSNTINQAVLQLIK